MRRLFALVVLTAMSIALAACGATKVKPGSVESEIKKSARSEGVKVESVSCPSDISADKGARVDCRVVFAGGGGETNVTAVQQGGGRFKIKFPKAAAQSGGGQPADKDEQIIRALFAELDKDPSKLCSQEFASETLLGRFSSEKQCLDAVSITPPTEVASVDIADDGTAVARVQDTGGAATVHLVFDEQAGWLVDSISQ